MGTASIAAASGVAPALAQDKIRVAMVVKALGIGFFDACRDGGLDAAKELGNVELIYTGDQDHGRRADRRDRFADRAESRRNGDFGQ
jgi:rhamnose transport system substrate-binding protein